MVVTNKVGQFQKKWIPGQKIAFLTRNSAFFFATPMKPPFLWLGRSRLCGMTTPPYPEGTLDTFGFLVGSRLATRRAVSWPRLPKVVLLGSKKLLFWLETNFLWSASKQIVIIITGHIKDNYDYVR